MVLEEAPAEIDVTVPSMRGVYGLTVVRRRRQTYQRIPAGVAMATVRFEALKTGRSWKDAAVLGPFCLRKMRRAWRSWAWVGRKWKVSGNCCGVGGGKWLTSL